MQSRDGTTKQNGRNAGDSDDMFCRVVSVIAAMLALRLCRYVRTLLKG